MIIVKQEIDTLKKLLDDTNKAQYQYVYGDHDEDEEHLIDWAHEIRPRIVSNPHLMMPIGFEECRILTLEETRKWGWDVPYLPGDRIDGFDVPLQRETNKYYLFYRKPSGQWFYLACHGAGGTFIFVSKSNICRAFPSAHPDSIKVSVQSFLETLYRCAETPIDENRTLIWHPCLWSPDQRESEMLQIVEASFVLL